jgi:hypothetical protein
MEYLDKPEKDETPQAHPAYWRGKSRGINDVLRIIDNVINGSDNGTGSNNHPGIEATRRSLLETLERKVANK